MRYSRIFLWFVACTLATSACAGNRDDAEMIVLSMEIHADGALLSTPVVAFDPGTDAAVTQGLAMDGSGGNALMKLVFHSMAVHETGPEILLDLDFGTQDTKHVAARHLDLSWNEPQEFESPATPGVPAFRVVVTPSRATRDEFLGGKEATAD